MYKCLYCGAEFPEEYAVRDCEWEEHTELRPDPRRLVRVPYGPPRCPKCGSDDLDEGYLCDVCGERWAEADGDFIVCEDCKEEIDKHIWASVDDLQRKLNTHWSNARDYFLWWAERTER